MKGFALVKPSILDYMSDVTRSLEAGDYRCTFIAMARGRNIVYGVKSRTCCSDEMDEQHIPN